MLDIVPGDELEFLLDWVGIDDLLDREPYREHSRESITAVLATASHLASTFFAPGYKEADQREPWLDGDGVHVLPSIEAAVREYAAAGLIAAPFPVARGGLDLPHVVHLASMAYCLAGNAAAMSFPLLTTANARLLLNFGTPAQVDAFMPPMLDGRYMGTMCISEVQAGSSLAGVSTKAIPDGDCELGRRFRLFGAKMWISGGDQTFSDNIVHLVLAKIPNADGSLSKDTRSLSLFIVPKFLVDGDLDAGARNDIRVTGLNHKMGYRGVPNCVVSIGDGWQRPQGSEGAVGYLVGEPGQGLPIMFQMMNEARIGIGLGGAMLAMRGYRASAQYARERVQGRPGRGAPNGHAAETAIIGHPDVRRMLLSQKAYCEASLSLILFCGRLVDDTKTAPSQSEREAAFRVLDILTPIAKTWPSELGVEANDLAIQVLGGYGYTRDFEVEQLYRDNRLNPIHEGTTGIQGIDLVGRKILRDGGVAFAALGKLVGKTVQAAAREERLAGLAAEMDASWAGLAGVVEDYLVSEQDETAMANATMFLSCAGHIVAAWLLLDQSVKARGRGDDRLALGKLWTCRFFFEQELPKAGSMIAMLRANVDSHVRALEDIF